jgi:hypothetical protein
LLTDCQGLRDPGDHVNRLVWISGGTQGMVPCDRPHRQHHQRCGRRRAHADGQLSPHTDLEALAQVLFALIPGYLLQKRIIGDVNPVRYADGIDVLLPLS